VGRSDLTPRQLFSDNRCYWYFGIMTLGKQWWIYYRRPQ